MLTRLGPFPLPAPCPLPTGCMYTRSTEIHFYLTEPCVRTADIMLGDP